MNFMVRQKDMVPYPARIRVLEPVMLFGIRGFGLHEGELNREQFTVSHLETGARVAGGDTRENATERAERRVAELAKRHGRSERDEILRALQTTRMKITSFEQKAQAQFPRSWDSRIGAYA